MGRKHCGKGRKCWLPAFSPYAIFSKVFYLSVDKDKDCLINGQGNHQPLPTTFCFSQIIPLLKTLRYFTKTYWYTVGL